jgi:hypothetical protein
MRPVLFTCLVLFSTNVYAAAVGPVPYQTFDDSPFKDLGLAFFFLEDFEQERPSRLPGLTFASLTPTMIRTKCCSVTGGEYSLWNGDPVNGTYLLFAHPDNPAQPLPTHVGLVVTGSMNDVIVDAFLNGGGMIFRTQRD